MSIKKVPYQLVGVKSDLKKEKNIPVFKCDLCPNTKVLTVQEDAYVMHVKQPDISFIPVGKQLTEQGFVQYIGKVHVIR